MAACGARGTAEENLSRGAARHRRPMGATDKRRQTLLSVLAAHGFVDGQNLVFVQRSADAHPERLDDLAAELKDANVDVIVTFGYPAALAAKKSTRNIPIVISAAGDPVATGLVDGWRGPAATSPA